MFKFTKFELVFLPVILLLFKKTLIILGLLIFTLPLLIYFPNEGTSDMGVWLEWTSHINRWGPLNAYSTINTNHDYERSDYPPISFINLYLALKASTITKSSWLIGIKILLIVYYLATWTALIYLSTFSRRKSLIKNAAVASALFLGGFYLVVNSSALGYLDITYAPYIIFSLVFFAQRKYFLSGIFFGLAALIKWMPVIILPAFLFYFISKKGRYYQIDRLPMFKFFGGIILTAVLLILGFLAKQLLLLSLVESLEKAFNRSSLADGALNFNYIVYNLMQTIYPKTYILVIKDNFYIFQLISAGIFLLVGLALLKSFLESKKNLASLLETSLMISWSYYIWRTGVHENHLFITILLALCLAIISTNRNNIRQYLWLCLSGLANFVVYFGIPINGGSIPLPAAIMYIGNLKLSALIAVINVVVYLVYIRKFLQTQSMESKRQ